MTLAIKKEQQTPALPTLDSDLNSKYTFDNFIQGDENRWSVAASLAVADSPGATYNPSIYLWRTWSRKNSLTQCHW